MQEARQIGPFAVFEVLRGNGGDDTGGGVPGQGVVLVQGELEQLVAERAFLIRRQACPMPCDKLPRLNCGQLAQLRLGVPAEDLEESIERGRRAIVALVEGGGGRFDTLGVG
jgi:hypothetical protein